MTAEYLLTWRTYGMFTPTLRRKIRILSHEVLPPADTHTPPAEATTHTTHTYTHAHVQHSVSWSQRGSVVDGRRLLDADRLEEVLGGNSASCSARCHVVRELYTGQRRAFHVGFCGRKRTCAADKARLHCPIGACGAAHCAAGAPSSCRGMVAAHTAQLLASRFAFMSTAALETVLSAGAPGHRTLGSARKLS